MWRGLVKGQALLSDFSISIALFLVIIGVSFFIQNEILKENISLIERSNSFRYVEDIGKRLLSYEGDPPNWDPSNFNSLGFSTEKENEINWTKISYLGVMPYETYRIYFIKDLRYNFFLNITYMNKTPIFSYGVYNENAREISKMVRIGKLNNTVVKVDIFVWR